MSKIKSFFKSGFKNVFLLSAGIVIGTGFIYAVSADNTQLYYLDADGDGYGTGEATSSSVVLEGYSTESGDCDDTASSTNPGASEVCDGADNNCNDSVDEGVLNTYYYDFDGDLYGFNASTTEACEAPENYVVDGGDCDESATSTNPGVNEVCDGIDNNCDGSVDEDVKNTYYYDFDNDTFGTSASTTLACAVPENFSEEAGDCNDSNSAINPDAQEEYDGIDNNCNGEEDEGYSLKTYYRDFDGDSFGDSSVSTTSYTSISGYVLDKTDCNDDNDTVYPGATELCDSLDNDCDTVVDEDVSYSVYFIDNDGDGYGSTSATTSQCSLPEGYSESDNDCNDDNSAIYPGAVEVYDEKDNDCDGQIDEGISHDNDSNNSDDCDDCHEYKNHGSFVSYWAHKLNILKKEGVISGKEKGQTISQIAKDKNVGNAQINIQYNTENNIQYNTQHNYGNGEQENIQISNSENKKGNSKDKKKESKSKKNKKK